MDKKKNEHRIIKTINEIYRDIGTRVPGGEDDQKTQEYIRKVIANSTDEIVLEDLSCFPKQNIYFLNFLFIGYSAALFIYLISPLFCFLLNVFLLANLLLFRFYNLEMFSYLLPKVRTKNIIGKIKANGESKNKIIFCANFDSPFVAHFRFYCLKNYPALIIKFFTYFFPFVLFFNFFRLFSWFNSITEYFYLFAFIPVIFFFFHSTAIFFDKSFGASNNLSGVAILHSLSQYFQENRLDNTEIWLLFSGAGNNGTAFSGINYFIKNNLEQLKKNTSVINIASGGENNLCLIEKERETLTKNNTKLGKKAVKAAKKLNIELFPHEIQESTSATFFSWENIPAVTFTSLDKNSLLRYDLKEDLPQYLTEDKLQKIYKICIEMALMTDEK